MTITNDLIFRLEHLARLELTDAERTTMSDDLNKILVMVEKLQELDTRDVTPLVYLNEDINVSRPDHISGQVTQEAALSNAPDQDGTFFKVPKVIDL
jgi:aspartyl-tRNA(Asn)/glutamyl-tRNA(Gln) amidotransferase subunit C